MGERKRVVVVVVVFVIVVVVAVVVVVVVVVGDGYGTKNSHPLKPCFLYFKRIYSFLFLPVPLICVPARAPIHTQWRQRLMLHHCYVNFFFNCLLSYFSSLSFLES